MFWSRDYSQGAAVLTKDDIANHPALEKFGPDLVFQIDFEHALALTEDNIKALVFKYHDASYIAYGADSTDFPLCLDFAELAAADVRKGAILQRLKERAAFGVAELTKNDDSRHAINFAMTAKQMFFYEPQNGLWLGEKPNYLKTLDEMYF